MTDRESISKDVGLDENLNASDQDAQDLQNLGIAPSKMKRNFNVWSLLFMSFCTSVTWEAISSTIAQALTAGGSSSLVWGYVASAVGAFLIVLCMGEYSSMIPTAGGQYHYVAELSPPKIRRILSWYAGWITMIGWILCAVAGIFASAMQIQSWIILFKDDYNFQRWHTSLLAIALTTYYTIFSIFQLKYLHHLMFVAMFAHVVGYFSTSIYLLANVEHKNSAKYVFTDFSSFNGWDNAGVSWSIGLLSASIGFVQWDSSLHMAEEMTNASRDLPRTIISSIGVSGVLTFPWVIAIAFCITDIQGVLAGPAGSISPMAQLYYNVSGGSQAATIGLTAWLPILGMCGSGSSIMSATSRTVWAFARDGGLPNYFVHIGDKTKAPTRALVLTWASVCAICLIYIGNATAYLGISSACTVALLISYAMPLAINVIWGFKYCDIPRKGFTLGRYHRPLAAAGLAWATYLSIFMFFPTYMPVTKDNMNYASVVVVFGFCLATFCWFTYGRSGYIGVTHQIQGH